MSSIVPIPAREITTDTNLYLDALPGVVLCVTDHSDAAEDPEALIEQIDPEAHMAMLDQERLIDEISRWDDDRLARDCVYGQPIEGVRLLEGVVA